MLPEITEKPPKPFLKWAGGKGQLLDKFASLYPSSFMGYHEPFVGSAAVYFHLSNLRLTRHQPLSVMRVYLADSNSELVNCYIVVRDNLRALLPLLETHKLQHSETYYYRVREQSPCELTDVERAARFIYLNKTCFNGLYRVNRNGQFNVPIGSYKNPSIYDAKVLERASTALRFATITVDEFHKVLDRAQRGDFVYFDPPYFPLTKTASFTSYTQDNFGEGKQRELSQVFRDLDNKGCSVMLSNSWTEFILDLYKDYKRIEVKASRAINSKGDGRGKVSELVVLNYEPAT